MGDRDNRPPFKTLESPRKIRWHGRSYTADTSITLGKKTYFITKRLSGKRERYMAFDPWSSSEGEMWLISGIDGRNLSTKLQAPGLVDKLKRLSRNDGRLPIIFSYHQVKNGRVYLVNSWTEGEDLGRYLKGVRGRKRPRPSAWQTCMVMRGLAHALYKIHNLNIVHGDLNPRNLILQRDTNRLAIIDFGSAWLVEYTTVRDMGDGVVKEYAAPELLRGQSFVDARSDQFSLGVTWYEMLTLKVPYGTYGGKLALPQHSENRAQIEASYQAPSTLSPDQNLLSREGWILIDRIVKRCLEVDTDRRYPTDRALLDDVEQLWRVIQTKKLSAGNELFLRALDWTSRFFD